VAGTDLYPVPVGGGNGVSRTAFREAGTTFYRGGHGGHGAFSPRRAPRARRNNEWIRACMARPFLVCFWRLGRRERFCWLAAGCANVTETFTLPVPRHIRPPLTRHA